MENNRVASGRQMLGVRRAQATHPANKSKRGRKTRELVVESNQNTRDKRFANLPCTETKATSEHPGSTGEADPTKTLHNRAWGSRQLQCTKNASNHRETRQRQPLGTRRQSIRMTALIASGLV